MHCNLIIETLGLENEIETRLLNISIQNIRIFNNYYLLRLANKWQWNQILQNIGEIDGIRFVLTPILEEGFYNGILTPQEWQSVNEITQNRGVIHE